MKRLNIFLTKEELEEANGIFSHSQLAGLVAAQIGPQRSGDLEEQGYRFVYSCALKHGVPEKQGYYGFDRTTGELIEF